jgi:hypothetical protein
VNEMKKGDINISEKAVLVGSQMNYPFRWFVECGYGTGNDVADVNGPPYTPSDGGNVLANC